MPAPLLSRFGRADTTSPLARFTTVGGHRLAVAQFPSPHTSSGPLNGPKYCRRDVGLAPMTCPILVVALLRYRLSHRATTCASRNSFISMGCWLRFADNSTNETGCPPMRSRRMRQPGWRPPPSLERRPPRGGAPLGGEPPDSGRRPAGQRSVGFGALGPRGVAPEGSRSRDTPDYCGRSPMRADVLLDTGRRDTPLNRPR